MAAANTEPLTRPLPPAQQSTMMAYPNPSYPMPPGALAIQNAMLGNRRNMGADAAAAGAAGNAMPGTSGLGMTFGAPGGGTDQTMVGNAMDAMGPTTQTAPGGVIQPEAPGGYSNPANWQAFMTRLGVRDITGRGYHDAPPTGAVPIQPPSLMRANRLPATT